MPESFSSSKRRLLLLGVLVAGGALLWSIAMRRDEPQRVALGGNFGVCANLTGDGARSCYRREVSLELSVVGASTPQLAFAAPSDSGEVTFASDQAEQEPLLCDLHARVGVVDAQVPSWLGWTEPLTKTAPVS